ncbi:MAG: UvrB/UvrC motif-containing protein [Gemmataceae bacterium]|nr:UvrB/UvrC motif-containing protein [Gemmataceae bacterium]
MDGLFHHEPFHDFGPCGLAADAAASPVQRVHGERAAALRAQVRVHCPAKPGVYGMLDAAGELIYLGKAKLLRDRLLSYFRPGSRPPKATRILRHSRAIVWEIGTHEFAALLREQELIRRWRPRWNVQGQPLRRRLAFVCLGRGPAPYVLVTRQPPSEALATVGPVPWTPRTVKAIQRVNDVFRLRDCPQPQEISFPEQGGLYPLTQAPGCMRAELQTCLAPCTGECTQADYARQARAALAFLTGATDPVADPVVDPVADLERRMRAAAAAQQFERAAALRDHWADLHWLAEQLARVRHAQAAMSFVYPVTGWNGVAHWHLIHGARVLASLPAPRNGASAGHAAEMLDAVYAGRRLDKLLTPYEHHDGRLIVMQWFRRFPGERKKTLTPEQARDICRRLANKSA